MSVQRNIDTLKFMTYCSPSVLKEILKDCKSDLIKAISEIVHNVLYTDIALRANTKAKLKPFEKNLVLIANKKVGIEQKKIVLVKQGDKFLPTILKPALKVFLELE